MIDYRFIFLIIYLLTLPLRLIDCYRNLALRDNLNLITALRVEHYGLPSIWICTLILVNNV